MVEKVLDDATRLFVGIMIGTLVSSDRLTAVEELCGRTARSDQALGPQLVATLTAMRSLALLRDGQIPRAVSLAERAMDELTPRSWGFAIGLPLSVLITGRTQLGDLAGAARHLDTRVPELMFETPAGLLHRQARGYFHLGCDRPAAAVTDFTSCAELATSAGFDLPGLVAWRLDLARARLANGQDALAAGLAEKQLATLTTEQPRLRGYALRILAASSPPAQRCALLRRAVRELEDARHPLQLTCARAELARALRGLGETEPAHDLERQVSAYTHEHPWLELHRLALVSDEDGGTPHRRLTPAEARVADLARRGHSNQQISEQLQVTVSTVEQHLTRVYRKLRLRRRQDLATVTPNPGFHQGG